MNYLNLAQSMKAPETVVLLLYCYYCKKKLLKNSAMKGGQSFHNVLLTKDR